MARLRLIRDSRGKRSWSLTLAVPALVLMTARFLLAGLTIVGVQIPPWPASEYALAAGIWLAYVGQREFMEKRASGTAITAGVTEEQ